MAQSNPPSSNSSNSIPDDKPASKGSPGPDVGNAQLQSTTQQSLLGRVRENLDLTKHLGWVSSQSTAEKSADGSPTQLPLTTRLWQAVNALEQTVTRGPAVQKHVEKIDQVNDPTGVAATSRGISDESHAKEPAESDGKTWSHWAAENAFKAKDSAVSTARYVTDTATSKLPGSQWAAENAFKAKDSAVSTARYVTDTATSKLPGSQWAAENAFKAKDSAVATARYVTDTATSKFPGAAQPGTDMNTKKGDVGRGDKKSATQTLVESGTGLKNSITKRLGYSVDDQSSESADDKMPMSVQDVIDRYSTTSRTPEAGQQSVTKAVIDFGLGLKDGIATQLGYGPQPDTQAATRAAGIQEQTRDMAETWRQSAVSAFTPGNGDRELARTICNKFTFGR